MATAPEPTAFSQLTTRQRAFVEALCSDPNMSATKAAIVAGYRVSSAHVEGNRQLKKAKVRAALGERLKDTAPTSPELAARWDRVSRATLDDFYTKRIIEKPTRIQQPLAQAIELTERQLAFDRELAQREAEFLGLTDQALSDYIASAMSHEQQQRLKMLRWQMELERNPGATRTTDGPAEKVEVLELDLVKAQKAGVLDLARAIKPTAHGIGVELRDPDAALDKLARMAGAYEKDNEQSRTQVAVIEVVAPAERRKGARRE